jgi:uncharacterized OB-fold protein
MTAEVEVSEDAEGNLVSPYVLEYTYRRSVGPVIGAFLTGLRDGVILGARTPEGEVLVPPAEYDSRGRAMGDDLVAVGPGGEVKSWAWVERPRPEHPLDHPFAFALIALDGASTSLLHVVDGPRERLRTGARVEPRWCAERVGHIADIEAFEVVDG